MGRIPYHNPDSPADDDLDHDPRATSRWKRLSRLYRSRNPLCAACQLRDRDTLANLVHHVIEVKERPDLAFSWDNLQSLCYACHNREHNRRQTG